MVKDYTDVYMKSQEKNTLAYIVRQKMNDRRVIYCLKSINYIKIIHYCIFCLTYLYTSV